MRKRIKEPGSSCQHYWLVDSKNIGRCKICHERREFPTWFEIEDGIEAARGRFRFNGAMAKARAVKEGKIKLKYKVRNYTK